MRCRWYVTCDMDVQKRVAEREAKLMGDVAEADKTSAALASAHGQPTADAFLSNFSITQADRIVDEWVSLFGELFVKYRDGLVVSPPPPPAGPSDLPPPPDCTADGYSEEWYERVLKDTGERYLVPPAPSALRRHAETKRALLLSIRK